MMYSMTKVCWGFLGVCLVTLFFAEIAWADQVQLVPEKDSRVFTGKLIQGIPDAVKIDANGVIVTVERRRMLSILFDKTVSIKTITNDVFEGKLLSSLPETFIIKTESGEVDIKKVDIKIISLDNPLIREQKYSHQVRLKDGRSFNGNLSAGIPDPLDIEVQGIIIHVDARKIQSIQFKDGERIDRVQTWDGEAYAGKILSELPSTIILTTAYGSLEIKQRDVTRIESFIKPSDHKPPLGLPWVLILALVGVAVVALWMVLL